MLGNLPLVSICVNLNILYILCSINSSGLTCLLECLSSEPITLFDSLFCNTKPPHLMSLTMLCVLAFSATVECGIAGVAGRLMVC